MNTHDLRQAHAGFKNPFSPENPNIQFEPINYKVTINTKK